MVLSPATLSESGSEAPKYKNTLAGNLQLGHLDPEENVIIGPLPRTTRRSHEQHITRWKLGGRQEFPDPR
jgi:hypothetical protein